MSKLATTLIANFRKRIFIHCRHRLVRRSRPFPLRLIGLSMTGPEYIASNSRQKSSHGTEHAHLIVTHVDSFVHVSPSIWRQSYVRRLQQINNISQVIYVCSYFVVGSALLWNWFTMSGGLELLQLKEEDVQKFLAAQAHIGDHNVTLQMAQYVYKVRNDGKWVWQGWITDRVLVASTELTWDLGWGGLKWVREHSVEVFISHIDQLKYMILAAMCMHVCMMPWSYTLVDPATVLI